MAGVREGIAFVIWPVPHYDSDTLVRYQLNDCVVAFPPQHNRSHQVVLECASLCACNSRFEMQEVVDYSVALAAAICWLVIFSQRGCFVVTA